MLLVGESSGKASRGVATKTVGSAGMAAAQEKAQLAGSEIGRAKLVCIVTQVNEEVYV